MRRRLRSRIQRWSASALALATVGALAVAGVALAAASSAVPGFSFAPNNPARRVHLGKLSFHTHTNYTASSTTNRIQPLFDDDFQFNPDSFPKCNPANLAGNPTMRTALTLCRTPGCGRRTRARATGRRRCRTSAFPDPHACVCVFTGQGSPVRAAAVHADTDRGHKPDQLREPGEQPRGQHQQGAEGRPAGEPSDRSRLHRSRWLFGTGPSAGLSDRHQPHQQPALRPAAIFPAHGSEHRRPKGHLHPRQVRLPTRR